MLARRVGHLARRLATTRAISTIPGATSDTLSIRGVNLFYVKNGDAGLPLVCIPGSMGAPPKARRPADCLERHLLATHERAHPEPPPPKI